MKYKTEFLKTAGLFVARGAHCQSTKNVNANDDQPSERSAKNYNSAESDRFRRSVDRSQELLENYILIRGIPGLSVGVSVDGKIAWARGFGYANVEQRSPCTEKSVMRIGSINKPIIMAIVAELVESGQIDLDAEIQKYLPDYPKKQWENEPVSMTVRHLATNTSGIRHYDAKDNVWSALVRPKFVIQPKKNNEASKEPKKSAGDKPVGSNEDPEKDPIVVLPTPEKTPIESPTENKKLDAEPSEKCLNKEELVKKPPTRRHFPNAKESLVMFAEDPLVSKPGSKFAYSTHGYTVLGAIVESVTGSDLAFQMGEFCWKKLGVFQTFVDRRQPIIRNRSAHYFRDSNHVINNVIVGESHWPGAVLSSTVKDLLIFANFMLDSYENWDGRKEKRLKRETVRKLWSPAIEAGRKNLGRSYGMGWRVEPGKTDNSCQFVYHTGAGAGSSSVLFIKPVSNSGTDSTELSEGKISIKNGGTKGVCVVILANIDRCHGMEYLASEIAHYFESES